MGPLSSVLPAVLTIISATNAPSIEALLKSAGYRKGTWEQLLPLAGTGELGGSQKAAALFTQVCNNCCKCYVHGSHGDTHTHTHAHIHTHVHTHTGLGCQWQQQSGCGVLGCGASYHPGGLPAVHSECGRGPPLQYCMHSCHWGMLHWAAQVCGKGVNLRVLHA